MSTADPNHQQPPTATTRTLHLPELLEQILLTLPPRELLLAQRVSKAFHRTISASPKIQRALFFAPDPALPSSPTTYLNPSTGATSAHLKPQNNRLLLRAFPGVYPTVSPVLVNLPPSREDELYGRPGPELWRWDVCISFPAAVSNHNNNNSSSDMLKSTNTTASASATSSLPLATHPSTSHPTASWRRMYLSQPPCTALHLVRRWRRSAKTAIAREGGITMGDFVHEVTKGAAVCGGWSEGLIASDRDWHFEGTVG